jgi:hypothetical protein
LAMKIVAELIGHWDLREANKCVDASLIGDSGCKTTGALLREIGARWRACDRARRRQNGYMPFARAETGLIRS